MAGREERVKYLIIQHILYNMASECVTLPIVFQHKCYTKRKDRKIEFESHKTSLEFNKRVLGNNSLQIVAFHKASQVAVQ